MGKETCGCGRTFNTLAFDDCPACAQKAVERGIVWEELSDFGREEMERSTERAIEEDSHVKCYVNHLRTRLAASESRVKELTAENEVMFKFFMDAVEEAYETKGSGVGFTDHKAISLYQEITNSRKLTPKKAKD